MANKNDNLIPQAHELTVEEASRGGINSGIARREKATMKATLEMLLNETHKNGKTYRELATLGLLKGAINGNATNYRTILETIGEIQELQSTTTPTLNINIVDNSKLEEQLYEENRHNENDNG